MKLIFLGLYRCIVLLVSLPILIIPSGLYYFGGGRTFKYSTSLDASPFGLWASFIEMLLGPKRPAETPASPTTEQPD